MWKLTVEYYSGRVDVEYYILLATAEAAVHDYLSCEGISSVMVKWVEAPVED